MKRLETTPNTHPLSIALRVKFANGKNAGHIYFMPSELGHFTDVPHLSARILKSLSDYQTMLITDYEQRYPKAHSPMRIPFYTLQITSFLKVYANMSVYRKPQLFVTDNDRASGVHNPTVRSQSHIKVPNKVLYKISEYIYGEYFLAPFTIDVFHFVDLLRGAYRPQRNQPTNRGYELLQDIYPKEVKKMQDKLLSNVTARVTAVPDNIHQRLIAYNQFLDSQGVDRSGPAISKQTKNAAGESMKKLAVDSGDPKILQSLGITRADYYASKVARRVCCIRSGH